MRTATFLKLVIEPYAQPHIDHLSPTKFVKMKRTLVRDMKARIADYLATLPLGASVDGDQWACRRMVDGREYIVLAVFSQRGRALYYTLLLMTELDFKNGVSQEYSVNPQ